MIQTGGWKKAGVVECFFDDGDEKLFYVYNGSDPVQSKTYSACQVIFVIPTIFLRGICITNHFE